MTSGSGRIALTEQVLTMVPAPRSSRCGSAARVVRTAARKWMVSPHSQSSSVREEPAGSRADRAHVVYQDVQPTVGHDGLVDQPCWTVWSAQIHLDGGDLAL